MRFSYLLALLLSTALCSGAGWSQSAAVKSDADAGKPDAGKMAFAKAGCPACHGDQGQGTSIGPRLSLPGLERPEMMHYVRQPSGSMPPFSAEKVSDPELIDIYAYLKSVAPSKPLELLAGDLAKGKKLFVSYGCYECHGTEGQGASIVVGGVFVTGARIGPPPVSQPVFTQYVHHPTGQMPPYTEKVTSDQDLADIYAFLKSIAAPPASVNIPLLNQ